MRLSVSEQNAIRDAVKKELGTVELYLFGSRTDDNKKGGDIDLLVVSENDSEKLNHMRRATAILVEIKSTIGEQKIDLLFATREMLKSDPFYKTIFLVALNT